MSPPQRRLHQRQCLRLPSHCVYCCCCCCWLHT